MASVSASLMADYRAMTDSGMLRGEVPGFQWLMERIALLEQQCNAISRTAARNGRRNRGRPLATIPAGRPRLYLLNPARLRHRMRPRSVIANSRQ